MEANELFLYTMERVGAVLKRALDGLGPDELKAQPAGPGSNPIGWLAWHLSRVQDNYVARASGQPSVWESGGWANRFGMAEPVPQHKPDNVHTFDGKDSQTLTAYYDAVAQRTAEFVKTLEDDDYAREFAWGAPDRPPITITEMLSRILNDNTQHTGQIAYLRGILKGQGWYGV